MNTQTQAQASHTPIPWDFVEGRTLLHIETRHDNEAGAGIAVCSLPKSAKPNAAMICRAVNCHEELVSALEYYASDAAKEHGYDNGALARAILARAKA